MAIFQNAIVSGGGAAAYEIPYSGDFSGSSDVLYRTPSSASNRKTWTKSFWMKRGATGDGIIMGGNGAYVDTECGLYVQVSDHGNVTVYELAGAEIWSAV